MTISGILPTFLVGCFGGLLGEMVKWYQLKDSAHMPDYARNALYWIITVLMILSGGGLALLYGVDLKNALLVANIGLSAPLIIKALAGIIPVETAPASQPVPVGPSVELHRETVLPERSATTRVSPNSVINFLAGR